MAILKNILELLLVATLGAGGTVLLFWMILAILWICWVGFLIWVKICDAISFLKFKN